MRQKVRGGSQAVAWFALTALLLLLFGCEDTGTNRGEEMDQQSETVNQTGEPSSENENVSKTISARPAYSPLGNGIFPIGAWVAPPPRDALGTGNPNFITDESYALAKEAGLNMIYGLYERVEMNVADVLRALDAAQANGLRYVVSDAAIQAVAEDPELMEQSVALYENHPAFLGHMVMDEPSAAYFPMLGENYAAYRERFPDKMFYINLLPMYASRNQLFIDKTDEDGGEPTVDEYGSYLGDFLEQVPLPYISYDYYPLEGEFPELKSGYFENMSMVRRIAREHDIPFWVFVQTVSWGKRIRVATPPELAWQVHTALAYGAQGMQYFTFWQPVEEGFRGGMIDRDGVKQPIFDTVKEINAFIADVGPALMRAKSLGVMVAGDSPVPVPEQDVLAACPGLAAVSSDSPLLIGCFEIDGLPAYYVVNLSLEHAQEAALRLADDASYTVYRPGHARERIRPEAAVALGPGQGALILNNNLLE